jgi:hypothetical protein
VKFIIFADLEARETMPLSLDFAQNIIEATLVFMGLVTKALRNTTASVSMNC